MMTASFLANAYHFRPEFQDNFSSPNCGLAIDVQPIDAPEILCAGGKKRVRSMSNKFDYTSDILISRENF